MEAQDQHVIGVDRTRLLHPRPVLREQVRRQPGEQILRRQEGGILLDEAMDGEVADGEFKTHDGSLPQAGGGTEILTKGRLSIRSWNASSFG